MAHLLITTSLSINPPPPPSGSLDMTVAAGSPMSSINLASVLSSVSPDEFEVEIMPDGVTVDGAGLISGTPVEPGYFEMFCQARGASDGAAETYTMEVTAPITYVQNTVELQAALDDHEASGTGPIIIELLDGTYNASELTIDHQMTHWCLVRSAIRSLDHSTVDNWTGGATISGSLNLDTSQKIRFEHVKFYMPKTGGATSDQSSECAVFYNPGAYDLHFSLCEFYSDTIDKSNTGYAGNWPNALRRESGSTGAHGLHADRCHFHDLNTGPEFRSDDQSVETPTTKRSLITRCVFKDLGRSAGSISGSFHWRRYNVFYGAHSTAQAANPFHVSSLSYNGPGNSDHYEVHTDCNICVPVTSEYAGASGIKYDNFGTTDTSRFIRSSIVGNILAVTDNQSMVINNGAADTHLGWNLVLYDRISSTLTAGITDVGGSGAAITSPFDVLDVSADAPDLSNIPTDGTYYVTLTGQAGSQDKGYNIIAIDNVAKTITLNTPVRNTTVTSGMSWIISNRRNNPNITANSTGGIANLAKYFDNMHCSFDGLILSGSVPDHDAPRRNTIGTDFISDGDGSVEDGGQGDTLIPFEDVFDGPGFKGIPLGQILSRLNAKAGGRLLTEPGAEHGIGPTAGAFVWPANFENRPAGVLRRFKYPDWDPGAWSIPAITGAATSFVVESAAVQITGMGNAVPTRLQEGAAAGTEFRILAADGTTVVHDWGTAQQLLDADQHVQMRLTSSGSAATVVEETLYIGVTASAFSVTTSA